MKQIIFVQTDEFDWLPRKTKFAGKKIISSEAISGMKLKLCRNIHNISLYKNYVLLLLLIYFGCYGNFKFPLTCNGKNENWHLLLSHCRYLGGKIRNAYLVVFYQT